MRKISFQTVLTILTGALALNTLLWGFFAFDAVAWLSGGARTVISRIALVVLGLAALSLALTVSRRQRREEDREEGKEDRRDKKEKQVREN